jgi:glutaredoxin 2
MYRDVTNVEYEVNDYTVKLEPPEWVKKSFKNFGSHAKKKFNRFTTKDKYTCNITHNTESTAFSNVNSDRKGSQLIRVEK